MEEWKDICGYEGIYKVSNCGKVKSINRVDRLGRYVKEKILKPGFIRGDYLAVHLYKNGKRRCCKVHRLVAKAFIPNLFNHPQVNHINEVKQDNRVENLEWCTNEYNSRYGTASARMGESHKKPVYRVCLKTGEVKNYDSAIDASRKDGFNKNAISNCVTGIAKSHKNNKWYYGHYQRETIDKARDS